MNNQKSYAAAVGHKSLTQRMTPQTFQFTAEQLTKFAANVVIQIAQPQVCYARNSDFNIITENKALVINPELSNNQNVILATIYSPNGNSNFSLFQSINNLFADVMFVGDFNSKLESFGCSLWSYAQKYQKTT